MKLCVRTFTTSNLLGVMTTYQNGGYDNVADFKKEMRRRWGSTHTVDDIENGVELIPTSQPEVRSYRKQQVTVE